MFIRLFVRLFVGLFMKKFLCLSICPSLLEKKMYVLQNVCDRLLQIATDNRRLAKIVTIHLEGLISRGLILKKHIFEILQYQH